jgi:hypothetical protein
MCSTISSIIFEIFLQHLEQSSIKHILETENKIYCYNRYVDNILITYNENKVTEHQILENFNKLHKVKE